MPQAVSARGERTRVRLLASAVRRFGEAGYRETSLSAVARDAGVTPAAVYSYYPDKEGLFTAALDHDASTWLDESLAVDGAPAWFGVMLRLNEHLPGHPLAHRVLAGLEPEMLPRVLDLPATRRLRTLLADSLRTGQTAGLVRPDLDPIVVAEGLATIVEATLIAGVQTTDAGTFADPRRREGVQAVLALALLRPEPTPGTPPTS